MKNSTSVHSITDWSSNGTIDMKESTGKTKTALLLDKDYQVIAFGNEAWNKHQSPNNNDANKWLLFHRFKMNLYGLKQLHSINGASVSTETVFVSALKYCKQKAMQYLTQNNLTVNENRIQWAITVPAIWDEKAKGQMKQWAQQ
ncbi:hypothetical protein RFI_38852, partial [Reticulomyxa filosa]